MMDTTNWVEIINTKVIEVNKITRIINDVLDELYEVDISGYAEPNITESKVSWAIEIEDNKMKLDKEDFTKKELIPGAKNSFGEPVYSNVVSFDKDTIRAAILKKFNWTLD